MDDYLGIQELARQGVRKAEIARRLGLDRKTVWKYLKAEATPPSKQKRSAPCGKLDPFGDYLKERMAQGCINAQVLLREIRARGY